MKNKITISVVAVLILMQVIPASVSAQVGIGTRVPIQLDGEGIFGGTTTTDTGSSACQAADTVADQVQSVLSQGLSFLGDSPALVVQLQAELTKVSAAITCWSGVVTGGTIGGTILGNTLFGFTKTNATKEQAMTQIAALKQTRKQIEARLQVASQGFWKAVLVGILLKQTDQLTERLANQLTEKFKIKDYAKYVTALSETVYTNQMILTTVKDKRDQAIVRSMITNPILKNKIHPAIEAAANAYIGFEPNGIQFTDPTFYSKVGKIAEAESYKQEYQSRMIAQVDEVIAKAREAALAEVGQGGGYKSALNNCGPSISRQKQADAEYQAVLDEVKDRATLLQQIEATPTSTLEDKNRIKQDVVNSSSKLNSFVDAFGEAVYEVCEGINTPADKFKSTVQDLIGTQIKNFSDYNDNNLPLFQKLVVNIADRLINKFVFGQDVSTGDLINEAVGTVTSGIAGTIPAPSTFPTPPITANTPDPTPTTPRVTPVLEYRQLNTDQYSIAVNIQNIPEATSYRFTGPGVNYTSIDAQDYYKTFNVNAPSGSTYTLTVFNANGEQLVVETIQVVASRPRVNGEVTTVLQPRGPVLMPR